MPPESRLMALLLSTARFAAWQLERAGGGSARRWWALRRLQRLTELMAGLERWPVQQGDEDG